MKIGIIGSGIVGQTLAIGFEKHLYNVMVGSRDRNKLKEWKENSGFQGELGNFEETAKFGELIVLATKGTGAKDALEIAGINNLKGKIIIDTTNPISETEPPVNGVIRYFTDKNKSLMEELQGFIEDAHFVKAFNSVGYAFMINPDFNGVKPTMFICGNNEDAKRITSEILDKFGWETEDMGTASSAGIIESLCVLWCIPGFLKNEWSHAFKLLKK